MKRFAFVALALLAILPAAAQKKISFELQDTRKKNKMEFEFKLPDSLKHMTPWKPSLQMVEQVKVPAISMTSVVLVDPSKLPTRVSVMDNNTLRLHRVTISNGQMWNWSPYPDSKLDARTLSFPGPRR